MIKKITISLALCALTAPCFGAQRSPLSAGEQQALNERLLSLEGDIDAVRSALQAGADIHALSLGLQSPPLHSAASRGQLEIMSLLLAYGADINAQNRYGITALHEAVRGKKHAAVAMLLDRNAKINAASHMFGTPLDIAILNKDGEMIELLSRHGAKTHHQQRQQQQLDSCLITAISSKRIPEAISLLNQGANAHQYWLDHTTLLHEAALFSPELIIALLEHGALISACSREGKTPLHYAVIRSDKTIFDRIELLLEHGADKNARDNVGRTPHDIALYMRNMAAARMLQQ